MEYAMTARTAAPFAEAVRGDLPARGAEQVVTLGRDRGCLLK
jgi:hypothetical protein